MKLCLQVLERPYLMRCRVVSSYCGAVRNSEPSFGQLAAALNWAAFN